MSLSPMPESELEHRNRQAPAQEVTRTTSGSPPWGMHEPRLLDIMGTYTVLTVPRQE